MTATRRQSDDPSAFVAALVSEYGAAVLAVCLARSRDRHEAEDRMQDVFLKVLRQADALRDVTNPRAWLYQVARRVCTDHHRRDVPVSPLPPELPHREAPADARLERLLTALARLPAELRETLALYYLDGRSCTNVAECLGITPAAVRQRLVRGRLRLHELLREDPS